MIIYKNPKAFTTDHLQKSYGGHREALADMKRMAISLGNSSGQNSIYEFFEGVEAYRKMGALDQVEFERLRNDPMNKNTEFRLMGDLMPQQVALLLQTNPDALKDANELRKVIKEHGRYMGG